MDRRYGGRMSEGVRSMARDRVTWRPGPIATAVFLALASTPVAALSIQAVSTGTVNSHREPVGYLDAVGMALVAVLVAGVVAAALGGAIARHWPVAGLVVAVFVAWPVGIAMLPFAAAVRGIEYGGVWICIDSCSPWIRSSELSSGIGTYLVSQFVEAFGPIEVGILLVGIGYGFARHRHRIVAAGLGLAGFVAFNWWTIVPAGFGSWPYGVPAAGALIIGAAVWVIPLWAGQTGRMTSTEQVAVP